jgi:hypothetical protein
MMFPGFLRNSKPMIVTFFFVPYGQVRCSILFFSTQMNFFGAFLGHRLSVSRCIGPNRSKPFS